ncbi:MAG: ribosome biogenesis/translation initiation ATPase RLI [Candidatus Aenigmarchaeota archaeon]|nr:ribosome biogenesis/translation initiation ATPase RLI [Candidatus Aenigmarchaeota archaeon]
MKKRIVVHDKELCKFSRCGYQCIKVCPVNRSGDECIVVGEKGYPVFNEELCIGCGLCVKACEKAGFRAITIVNLPKELNESPIHRYGRNGFALYRLPIPKPGYVVGIIGPNGVGKTTVMNILSGNLKPNSGNMENKVTWDDLIERFKGTELQNYLENLSENKLKIAYKPQHVDLIPRVWKGKVRSLLEQEGDPTILVKKLGIDELLNKNVSELSGGELQLVAVAAVLLKNADFYFFDEPSSYLDVQQRLLVAKEIRTLAEKKQVMVVEHDLAVLDYLSDHVHILYGKPGAFGIVSNPYGVRVGINTYLEGYIKEENMRFRDKEITFDVKAHVTDKTIPFLTFPSFEKKFEGFKLKTEGGILYKGEIIGVLGPNGIGKTTFIKMLVGQIKPDKGEAIKDLKLSYKPQRLIISEQDAELTVGAYIQSHVGSKIFEPDFKKVIRYLGIERNMEKQMKNLSGGELQAVFIACALGREHDILLLDEPSAFLDIEQRLNISKIIRSHIESNKIACFIVDHDLQIIDTISDRIMVFEGLRGVSGFGNRPTSVKDGMNKFLKNLGVTFRRDPQTGRARANKPDSQKDREQKELGEYYYAG